MSTKPFFVLKGPHKGRLLSDFSPYLKWTDDPNEALQYLTLREAVTALNNFNEGQWLSDPSYILLVIRKVAQTISFI